MNPQLFSNSYTPSKATISEIVALLNFIVLNFASPGQFFTFSNTLSRTSRLLLVSSTGKLHPITSSIKSAWISSLPIIILFITIDARQGIIYSYYSLMSQNIDRRIAEIIRANKCQRNGCLSNKQDNLEVVWFGTKFDNKDITCSSCVIMNDLVVGRLEPVALNILPVSAFAQKFASQYNEYIKLRNSNDWAPKLSEAKKEEVKKQMDMFSKKLHQSLKGLVESLERFTKRVTERARVIFTVPEFEEIQKMNNDQNFSGLFKQIEILIKRLHRVGEESYRFVNEQRLKVENDGLRKTITDTVSMVNKTLTGLLKQIKTKTDDLNKI